MKPIPKYQETLLENTGKSNFSLYFSRMTEWHDTGEKDKDVIVRLGDKANLMLSHTKPTLDAIHDNQVGILESLAVQGGIVWEFRARLSSPYASGLGSGHPTETGMILDRNSGLPYIPASAIKGVLRLACALEIAVTEASTVQQARNKRGEIIDDQWEIDDQHPFLRRYFGDTDTGKKDSVRGQLIFLDAFPATIPTIKTDIMNPHFGKYYANEQGPLETENPIPVKFLAVAEKAEFVFRCFVSPLPCRDTQYPVTRPFDQTDENAVEKMFTRAFGELGFGAKTAVGYGRFVEPEINRTDFFLKLVAEDKERKKREEVERLYPWRKHLPLLEKADNWGDFKTAVAKLDTWKTEKEVGLKIKEVAERVRANNPKKWDTDRDKQVQEWLKASGVAWPVSGQDGGNTDSQIPPPGSNRVLDAAFKEFNNWKQRHKGLGLAIVNLSQPEAKSLRDLFLRWKVNESSNAEKKKAWKELKKYITLL
ncbi:MAG TPA: type III-B CRISPR module RAMP protein Cmr6 [Desulfobulbaceae bacterium]|nr:type III-B CRISPR module RAMP protein Cmr6 [Desulfobulbaceae bacterium]